MGMHINKALKMIKKYEGLALKPYYCQSGILTIGYGHTGKDVKKGMIITKKQAKELLKKDLVRFKKEEISKAIPLYCRGANGNKLSGLVKRRLEEQKLFNKEV